MPTHLILNQSNAQVIYMSTLKKLAEEQLTNKKELAFDPQGRILIDVRLNPEQLKNTVRQINKVNKSDLPPTVEGLNAALGRVISPATTISLDITAAPEINAQFQQKLFTALSRAHVDNPQSILDQLHKLPRGSIIALHQEFHFHLALASRIYQKLSPDLDANKIEKVHQETMLEVNGLVLDSYAKALKSARNKDGSLNTAKLNASLDKARQEIMPKAHTILMQQIVRQTGVILSNTDLKASKSGTSVKHLAEETTATPNDVLHTDTDHGLATLIAGSENTAHLRIKGNQFAHRQLITHSMIKNGDIEPNKNPRIQIRTPSPVLKEGLKKDSDYSSDVATKLAAITVEYDLVNRLSPLNTKPRAFIYNSFTAINDRLGDTGGNLQTQSAYHILKGSHQYNQKQLKENPDPVFCFVQNISVNGFGNELGYHSGNDLTTESTLMAEMALVHTLYDVISPEQQKTIDNAFKQYKKFLNRPNHHRFFSESPEGKEATILIQHLKSEWKNNRQVYSNDLLFNAKHSLKSLIANDFHFNHEYSKVVQTLSVFVEEASIGGCKSGNERAQAINGRVAILDSLLNKNTLSREQQEIASLLKNMSRNSNNIAKNASELKARLDAEYNKAGLQTASSIISLLDQGASAKIEGKPGHPFYISRNYGEEKISVMTNLHQSKAGSMQAHKDLTHHMLNAWKGHPQSWWSRMKSSPLGVAGALAGIITLVPAIIMAIVNYRDNQSRKLATDTQNAELQELYKSSSSNDELFEHSVSKITESLSGSTADKIAAPDKEPLVTTDHPVLVKNPAEPATLPENDSDNSGINKTLH